MSAWTPFDVRDVRFTAAGLAERQDGLLGHTSFEVGPIRLDGVMVRKTRDGRLCLSFPEKRGRDGTRHPIARPTTSWERARIENAVLGALRTRGLVE
jgi:hypothetical protein